MPTKLSGALGSAGGGHGLRPLTIASPANSGAAGNLPIIGRSVTSNIDITAGVDIFNITGAGAIHLLFLRDITTSNNDNFELIIEIDGETIFSGVLQDARTGDQSRILLWGNLGAVSYNTCPLIFRSSFRLYVRNTQATAATCESIIVPIP